MVIAITKLFNVLGFKLHGGNWLEDLQDGISGGVGGLGDVADSADDTTDSLGKASDAAKKLKGSLRAFDELKTINTPDKSDSGSKNESGSESIDLSGAISSALSDYESVWQKAFSDSQNKAQQYADTITSVFSDMWSSIEPVRTAISNLWDNGLSKLSNFTWTALKDFYQNFLVPMGEWTFGTEDSGLTRLVNVINDGLMAIDWETLNTSLKNFWIAIEPYAEQFGEGLIDFFEDISGIAVDAVNNMFGEGGAVQSITNWLNNNDPEKARSWGYAFGVLATAIGGLKIANSALSGIATFLKLIKDSAIVKSITMVSNGIKNLAKSIIILKSGGLLGGVSIFSKLADAMALAAGGAGTLHEAFVVMFGAVGTAIAGVGSIISGAVLAVVNFFSMWENGWSVVKEILKDLGIALAAVGAVILGVAAAPAAIVAAVVAAVSTIAIVVHDNWNAICNWFSGAGDWFDTNVITPVSDFFKGLWTTVSGYFTNLWTDISNVWKTVSGWFNNMVITPVSTFFNGLCKRIGQFFQGALLIVKATWKVVSTWFKDHLITPIKDLFGNLKDKIVSVFKTAKEYAINKWNDVSDWFTTNIGDPIRQTFGLVKDKIVGVFKTAKEYVVNKWKGVSDWFVNHVTDPVKKAFEKATKKIGGLFTSLWKSIKNGVVSTFNSIISGIESAINGIIGGINTLTNLVSLNLQGTQVLADLMKLQKKPEKLLDKITLVLTKLQQLVCRELKVMKMAASREDTVCLWLARMAYLSLLEQLVEKLLLQVVPRSQE